MTSDGTLVRVVGRAVASRSTVGVPTTSSGDLDAAVADDRRSSERAIWTASDAGARITRVDPATGAAKRAIDLRPPFPVRRSLIDTWWLAFGDGAAWATLPNHGAVARVDAASGDVRYFRIPYGDPFGVAVGGGSAWVATDRAVLQLDATTGALRAAVLVPAAGRTGFVSIAFGFGSAWLSNYDRGTLTELTPPGASGVDRSANQLRRMPTRPSSSRLTRKAR